MELRSLETEVPIRFMKISNGRGDREGESENKCINAPNQKDFYSHSSFVRQQNPCWMPSMSHRCVGYQALCLFTSLYCNCLATKGEIRKEKILGASGYSVSGMLISWIH